MGKRERLHGNPGPDSLVWDASWRQGGKEKNERFSFFSLVRKRFIRKRVFRFDSQGEGSFELFFHFSRIFNLERDSFVTQRNRNELDKHQQKL